MSFRKQTDNKILKSICFYKIKYKKLSNNNIIIFISNSSPRKNTSSIIKLFI